MRGLSTPNLLVAGVDRALVASAREVVVLADHTKLGIDTIVQTVAPDRIHHLVTNDRAPRDELDRFREPGVQVHVGDAGAHHGRSIPPDVSTGDRWVLDSSSPVMPGRR